MPTFTVPPTLTRRTAFRLTGGVVLSTVGLAAAAGCSSGTDTAATVDTLTAHLRLARRDAAAAATAIATLPDLAGQLGVVQSEREAHASSLTAEIDRVAGTDPSETTSAAATTTPAAAPPPTLDELKGFLGESQRAAADSAREESGYRAGLLGSISAACAVQISVVLA